VVDDDPVVRMLTSDCLAMFGHNVEALDCGEACLDRLKHGPLPDLVFLDMMMPTLTGIDVLRSIRSSPQTSALYVVMLSATQDAEQVLAQHCVKSDACLQKPFQMKDLAGIINRAADPD
jgi:CheY-like chemotaxis protein